MPASATLHTIAIRAKIGTGCSIRADLEVRAVARKEAGLD
jgi:hypothetical protein